jgi:hypothetical protein
MTSFGYRIVVDGLRVVQELRRSSKKLGLSSK